MKTVLIKADLKEEIAKAINDNQDSKVFGISKSGNIYTLEGNSVIANDIKEVVEISGQNQDLIQKAIDDILKGESYLFKFEDAPKSLDEKENKEELEKVKDNDIDIEAIDETEKEVKQLYENEKFAEVFERLELLEKNIKDLPEQILDDIKIKLSK